MAAPTGRATKPTADGKGLERSDPRVRVREEQLGKDQAGDGAVEKEIVPFDRRADGGGDDGAAQLHLMFGRGKLKGGDIGRDHEHSSRCRAERGSTANSEKFARELPTECASSWRSIVYT